MAFFFPGQGAQTVGMANDVAEQVPKAKELFEQASEILGYDLLQVCSEGPKEKLDSTVVSQPAIYVSSLAAIEKLRAEEGEVCLLSCYFVVVFTSSHNAITFAIFRMRLIRQMWQLVCLWVSTLLLHMQEPCPLKMVSGS